MQATTPITRHNTPTLCHFLLRFYVIATMLCLVSSSIIFRNSSLLLPTAPLTTSTSTSLDVYLPRPTVPFEWRVPNSDTMLLVVWYYRNMLAKTLYSCMIEALCELYQTAIYDHDDLPVRADRYQQQKFGVVIDIKRYTNPETPTLYYSTAVKTLLGIEQIYHTYSTTCGLSMIVHEQGRRVARAVIKPVGSDPKV